MLHTVAEPDRLAARQHGVLALWQLQAAGVQRRRAASWARSWRRLQRGVYLLDPVLTRDARVMGVVLAAGPVLAGAGRRTAGELLGLRDGGGVVDVVLPASSAPRISGACVVRARDLRTEDVTYVRGIPCTTVARTLLDCAALLNRSELRRLIQQARREGVLDVDACERQLDRHRGHRGARTLRELVAVMRDKTESELEDELLRLLRAAGLAADVQVNHTFDADGLWVRTDFRFAGARLVIEVDGWSAHAGRAAFEDDGDRALHLREAGWDVLRLTWRQVFEEPERVVALVARSLRG